MAVEYQWVIVGERRDDGRRPCAMFGIKPDGDPADPDSYSVISGTHPGIPRIDLDQFEAEVADTLPEGVLDKVYSAMDRRRSLVHVEEDAGVASAQEVLEALRAAGLTVRRG